MLIRHRLFLGSLIAIAAVGSLGFVALRANTETSDEIKRISVSSIPESDAARNMLLALQSAQAEAQELLVDRMTLGGMVRAQGISSQSMEAVRSRLSGTLSAFRRYVKESRRATNAGIQYTADTDNDEADISVDREELQTLDTIDASFQRYSAKAIQLLELPAPEIERSIGLVNELRTEFGPLNGLVEAYSGAQSEEMHRDTQEALAHVERARMLLLSSLLAVILASFVTVLWNTTAIVKPINLLMAASERLAADQSGATVDYRSRDELGRLALTFNEMSGRVRHRDRALHEAHTRLEERIGERTAALAEANENLRTEREALRETELRFKQMAENVEQVFWMANPGGQEIIYVSPAYEKIWARTCAELYANPKSWIEAIVPEDRPSAIAAVIRNTAGETYDIEYRITRNDESERWIRDRGFPVRDAAGRVVRVCGVCEDITERKTAEAELQVTGQRLRDAFREAGMAEVAASVLHNVGNVLNSVNISLCIAAEKVQGIKAVGLRRIAGLLEQHADRLPAFFTEHPQGVRLPKFLGQLAEHLATEQHTVLCELASLKTNLEHINEIVATQQSYTKVGGLIEALPLDGILEDALRMNAAACERQGTRVVCDLDADLPPVPIDRNKMLLILVNLIRNAKYACDEADQEDKCITLRTQLSGGGLAKISVSDNGVGIPSQNLARIFEHGFTTRKNGHGFGLHSSALAAQDMGGALRVHSDGPGRGATFTVELPLAEEKL